MYGGRIVLTANPNSKLLFLIYIRRLAFRFVVLGFGFVVSDVDSPFGF